MDNPKVEVRETSKYGRGVFAKEDIKKDEFIASFDGDIYEYDSPLWNDYLEDHTMQFEERKWRDSKGIAHIINHSCEPNCGIKELFNVVAMRDIKSDEEITWDYSMTERNKESDWRMKCFCGSKNCRGEIGSYDELPNDVKNKYAGYVSEWLLK